MCASEALQRTVHPRACGERHPSAAAILRSVGASPRMRGTDPLQLGPVVGNRCIPAHAGNGRAPRLASFCTAVHPRACGERSGSGGCTASGFGASPRMRGTGDCIGRRDAASWCIPAHAGNGPVATGGVPKAAVHPRACGERRRTITHGGSQTGASPRMRGTGAVLAISDGVSRCIPAHAGNGCSRCLTTSPTAVHPRACGERGLRVTSYAFGRGASPRMRGTGRGRAGTAPAGRCIPAHAGNGVGAAVDGHAHAVHPRACGERDESCDSRDALLGASPRMRGTADLYLRNVLFGRCIPAHAGNG